MRASEAARPAEFSSPMPARRQTSSVPEPALARDQDRQRVSGDDLGGDVRRAPAARVVVPPGGRTVRHALDQHHRVELRACPHVQRALELGHVLDQDPRAEALEQFLVVGRDLEGNGAVEAVGVLGLDRLRERGGAHGEEHENGARHRSDMIGQRSRVDPIR